MITLTKNINSDHINPMSTLLIQIKLKPQYGSVVCEVEADTWKKKNQISFKIFKWRINISILFQNPNLSKPNLLLFN